MKLSQIDQVANFLNMRQIAVRVIGGLGNQLFQYGFALYCRDLFGSEANVTLDCTDFARYKKHDGYLLDNLNPVLKKSTSTELRQIYPLLDTRVCRAVLTRLPQLARNIVLEDDRTTVYSANDISSGQSRWALGYWQNAAYTDSSVPLIRQALAQHQEQAKISLMTSKDFSDYCALHVRRGDYVELAAKNKAVLYSEDYYRAAIEITRQKKPNVRFVVFSDDPGWCRNNLNLSVDDKLAVDLGISGAIEEIAAMSILPSHIIGNSTFGWWGARLATQCDSLVMPKFWGKTQKVVDLSLSHSWVRLL